MYTHTYTSVYTCIYMYVCVYLCMWAWLFVHMYACVYLCIQADLFIHMYAHTYGSGSRSWCRRKTRSSSWLFDTVLIIQKVHVQKCTSTSNNTCIERKGEKERERRERREREESDTHISQTNIIRRTRAPAIYTYTWQQHTQKYLLTHIYWQMHFNQLWRDGQVDHGSSVKERMLFCTRVE